MGKGKINVKLQLQNSFKKMCSYNMCSVWLCRHFAQGYVNIHCGQTLEHAQRCKFWSPACQFVAQNFEGKPLQQPEIKTLTVICERKQK